MTDMLLTSFVVVNLFSGKSHSSLPCELQIKNGRSFVK